MVLSRGQTPRCSGVTLEEAITETLRDLIENSTGCGCCDNDQEHAAIIKRALIRFAPELWPPQSIVLDVPALSRLYCRPPYFEIYKALRTRSITWA